MLFGILGAVILPPLLVHLDRIEVAWTDHGTVGATAGGLVAFLIALYLFRRVVTLPGIGIAGHVLPALADPQPMQIGDVKETFADISAIERDIGFHPGTTIDEGIPRFVAWYRDYHRL
jgi:hypothetical protein